MTRPGLRRAFRRCSQRAGGGLLIFAALVWLSVGSGAQGTPVQATSLPLGLPANIAYDASANLYLADTTRHVIRRVDPTGAIRTVAGTGTQGFGGDQGPAVAADLDSPRGLVLDSAGNLYFADSRNHRIRKVAVATGIITTIGGSGRAAFSGDGGPAVEAALNSPTALAIDRASNLYFADTGNHRVRKIFAGSGIIVTVAGTGVQGYSGDGGAAVDASIDTPGGLAVDGAHLYLSDTHNQRIRVVNLQTGIISSLAGTGAAGFGGDGAGAARAALALPQGLTLDRAGNLYVADRRNHRIRRIEALTGTISTVVGEGTEALSGDGGAPGLASVDEPRDATVSPAGLLTLADSGNQRVRQVSADNTIHTIAGLGTTESGVLSLIAPSVLSYGTGMITATIASPTPASGAVTFLETVGASPSSLGVVMLASNRASLSVAGLAAGVHHIVATYPGDVLHAAAQSSSLVLTVSPAALTAIPGGATMLYGQQPPALTGTLTGLLAEDTSRVVATFVSGVTSLSPAGAYPIVATLSGPAAGNYELSTVPASLIVAPAPSVTTLTASTSNAALGAPVLFTVRTLASTTGTPTGTVNLFDGTILVASSGLAAGSATFSVASLTAGSHTLLASYAGDGNFLPGTSVPQPETIGVLPAQDFSVASTTPPALDVTAGAAVSFSFSVKAMAALDSAINLSVSGLPPGATSSFNPAYVPPGTLSGPFTLTIQTARVTAADPVSRSIGWAIAAVGLIVLPLRRRRCLAGLLGMVLMLAGCGDRIFSRADPTGAGKTYPMTVTCTATGPNGILQHTAAIALTVR